MSQWDVGILSRPEEVAAYVDQARTASDTDKDSLGFLPERAYKEAAVQEKLLIAVIKEGVDLVYAGHLLHEAAPAKITVEITANQFAHDSGLPQPILPARNRLHNRCP